VESSTRAPALPRSFRFYYLPLGIAFFAFIFIGTNDGINGVLLPSFQQFYTLDKSGVSTLFFAGTCGYLVAAFTSGLMREHLGQRLFLSLGGACLLIGMAIMTTAPPWLGVLLTISLLGFGVAIVDAGLNSYVAALPNNSALLNYLHAFYGLGALLGPLLASNILAAGWGWPSVYLVMGAGALVLAGGMVGAFAAPPAPDPPPPAPDAAPQRNVMAATLALPLVWIGAIFLGLYVGMEVTVGSWAYSILTEERGIDLLLAGQMVSGYWLGLTVGRLVLGRATERFGSVLIIQLCLVGMAAGMALIWLAPGPISAAGGLALAGFSLGPIFPTVIAVMSTRVSARLLPSAIGFMASLGAGGAAFFPWIAGNLAEGIGLWAILPYTIGLTVAVLAVWLLFQTRLPKASSQ
jgi:fucose permease